MTSESLLSFVDEYGFIVIIILVFVEYLNIPGYPGGLTVPVAGIIVRLGYATFTELLLLSTAASMLAVMAVYGFGYVFAEPTKKLFLRSPKTERIYDKTIAAIEKYGASGLLFMRLIPVVRTFISIPAGLMKMKMREYIPVSVIGNFLYILVNMLLGYFLTSLFI